MGFTGALACIPPPLQAGRFTLLLLLSLQGCVATFSSLMGYQYHQKRCGKQPEEVEKPVFACPHCGKTYKSKAGHDYHVRSEHPSTVRPLLCPELTPHPHPPLPFTDCYLSFSRLPVAKPFAALAKFALPAAL